MAFGINYSVFQTLKAEDITRRITAFIAIDMRPISLIEGDGFNILMEYLAPKYTLRSRSSIRIWINDLYNAAKRKLGKNTKL